MVKKKKYNIHRYYGKDKNIEILMGVSIILATMFFIVGFFLAIGGIKIPGNILSSVDFFVFGVLCCIGPIGFYDHIKRKQKKEIHDKLPEFLRDIANSTSSGMTIYDAIRSASEGDYGRLTPELKMMAAQISWGISVKDALVNFAERINTNEIKRLAITMNKAFEIGGNTSSVFYAAAKELDQIKRVEQQRKTEMSMYSIVIFISFFVFLAVLLIIDKTIFAALIDVQSKMAGQRMGTIRLAKVNPLEVKNMFYTFVVVQSVGGGVLGGFMTDGRLSSGVRYGFILTIISFIIFKFFF
ncbi:MAG: type II secretion system F family protein [Candidatus Thermoplasmatota archaeon]